MAGTAPAHNFRPARTYPMSRFLLFIFSCLVIPFSASAGEQEVSHIKAELVRAFPELKSAIVKPSPVSGMYEVEHDSKIFSASAGEQEVSHIKAELVRAFPELKSAIVKPSPVSGMYEVEHDSKIFYATS